VLPGVPEMAERKVVQEVANMYGKTIHTWQSERDALPLGAPQLMMSFTSDAEMYPDEVKAKDEITGVNTAERREIRKQLEYRPKAEGADSYVTTGLGVSFKPEQLPVTVPGRAPAGAGGAHATKSAGTSESKVDTVPGTKEPVGK